MLQTGKEGIKHLREEDHMAGRTEMEAMEAGTGVRHKHRNLTEERDLLKRLNRIEGQVRGIKAMVEDERYCIDILNQVSAVQAALNSFNRILLTDHIHTCVVERVEKGDTEVIDELCRAIQKLMK